ncbi:glucuronate isomerase [candidate division KSB1 bacterium]|nr:glucuronate isomerase [candidate division KSB1 bacterium]
MTDELILDENRFFDSDPPTRAIARELYEGVKDLPILSPHGHVEPRLFSENKPFPDPTELFLIPDHYLYRMLYSQGIPLEQLGIPKQDGTAVEKDHRKIWRTFADHYYLFAGTPSGVWFNHELYVLFGIREKLTGDSAMRIYDQISEKLALPEYLPRALFEKFNIETLTTTDAAADTLEQHQKIKDSGWKGNVIPCFRPDAVINLMDKNWRQHIAKLSKVSGIDIQSFKSYISALENRRAYFKRMGAVSTDQGIFSPRTHELSANEAETIFQRALQGKADVTDADQFTAHMLMEMARMSIDDGLVMQIHPGAFRNHNQLVFDAFGPDKGSDIPVQTEYTHNLYELLNKYGNDQRLTLVVFTLDESTYARELAPLAGHYPCMKLGAAWWFHDSIEGMQRYRQSVTETAGIYNTVGFTDDTRAFPSIPARHDLSRRIDSNYLAGLVARHIIDRSDAERMSRALAYELAKNTYKL